MTDRIPMSDEFDEDEFWERQSEEQELAFNDRFHPPEYDETTEDDESLEEEDEL